MSVEFDFSEITELAASLGEVGPKTTKNVKKAVAVSAGKGKKSWAAAARKNAGSHLPAYPASIDYDRVHVIDGGVGTEVGPNLTRKQGALGIVEDSPGGVRGAPQRNYEKAQKVMAKDLVKGILTAVEQSGGLLN